MSKYTMTEATRRTAKLVKAAATRAGVERCTEPVPSLCANKCRRDMSTHDPHRGHRQLTYLRSRALLATCRRSEPYFGAAIEAVQS